MKKKVTRPPQRKKEFFSNKRKAATKNPVKRKIKNSGVKKKINSTIFSNLLKRKTNNLPKRKTTKKVKKFVRYKIHINKHYIQLDPAERLLNRKKRDGLYTGTPGWKTIKVTMDYFDDVIELSNSHDTHMGLPKDKDSDDNPFGPEYWKYLVSTEHRDSVLIGTFNTETGELEGMMGIYLWDGFPYWTILGFTLKPGKYIYNYNKNPVMPALWNTALKAMERLGRIKFYMLKNNKWLNPKLIQQWKDHIGKDRYALSIEAIIPQGTTSPYKGFSKLMYRKTFPADVHIMTGTLTDMDTLWKITSKSAVQ